MFQAAGDLGLEDEPGSVVTSVVRWSRICSRATSRFHSSSSAMTSTAPHPPRAYGRSTREMLAVVTPTVRYVPVRSERASAELEPTWDRLASTEKRLPCESWGKPPRPCSALVPICPRSARPVPPPFPSDRRVAGCRPGGYTRLSNAPTANIEIAAPYRRDLSTLPLSAS